MGLNVPEMRFLGVNMDQFWRAFRKRLGEPEFPVDAPLRWCGTIKAQIVSRSPHRREWLTKQAKGRQARRLGSWSGYAR
jgi:hypothetical protein